MCDGQALVMHDVLGMFDGFVSKFVKRYANLLPVMTDALAQWRQETADRTFPGPEHCFTMKDEIFQALLDELQIEE